RSRPLACRRQAALRQQHIEALARSAALGLDARPRWIGVISFSHRSYSRLAGAFLLRLLSVSLARCGGSLQARELGWRSAPKPGIGLHQRLEVALHLILSRLIGDQAIYLVAEDAQPEIEVGPYCRRRGGMRALRDEQRAILNLHITTTRHTT